LVDLLVASITSPSQAMARGQREKAVVQAMQRLPQESRDALRMKYVEGLPSKEIAERLGKSDGAIRVMLTRTLNKLQRILEDQTLFRPSE
jgi:RNA polymerase sigma-70 factor (ECF subfamily)